MAELVDTGWMNFSSVVDSTELGGTQAWGNPSGALTENYDQTTSTMAHTQSNCGLFHNLKFQNTQQKLKIGTFVKGIHVRFKHGVGTGDSVVHRTIQLIDGSSLLGQDKASDQAWTGGTNAGQMVFSNWGGVTDKWGLSFINDRLVNKSQFGVIEQPYVSACPSFSGIDVGQMRIYGNPTGVMLAM